MPVIVNIKRHAHHAKKENDLSVVTYVYTLSRPIVEIGQTIDCLAVNGELERAILDASITGKHQSIVEQLVKVKIRGGNRVIVQFYESESYRERYVRYISVIEKHLYPPVKELVSALQSTR